MTLAAVAALPLVSGAAQAASTLASHAPDMLPILAALLLILVGARLGGHLLERLGQPAVLGELVVGILLGNLGLVGYHGLDALRTLPGIDILAQVGVLLLLFCVGLETSLQKMMAVGLS